MHNLCPDDPEDRCPTCGGRIPQEAGIPVTEYYEMDDSEGSYTRVYCSEACISKRR